MQRVIRCASFSSTVLDDAPVSLHVLTELGDASDGSDGGRDPGHRRERRPQTYRRPHSRHDDSAGHRVQRVSSSSCVVMMVEDRVVDGPL